MTLQQQLKEDMKQAMRDKEREKLTTLRGLISAVTNAMVEAGKTPQDTMEDDQVIEVLRKEAKRRKDAIQKYTDGGRPELAQDEQNELEYISVYLPQMMNKEAIKPVVEAAIADMGDDVAMGPLMGRVMGELKGQADGQDVKEVIQSLL